MLCPAKILGINFLRVAANAKSNEITAVPKLLVTLELAGTVASVDVMGCQREIVGVNRTIARSIAIPMFLLECGTRIGMASSSAMVLWPKSYWAFLAAAKAVETEERCMGGSRRRLPDEEGSLCDSVHRGYCT